MKKYLFITINDVQSENYGGSQCSVRNLNLLKKSGDVEVYNIQKKSTLKSFLSMLSFQFPPIQRQDIKCVLGKLAEDNYEGVFLDSTVLGKFAKKIKKKHPKVKIVSFSHNVEIDYIKVRFADAFHRLTYGILVKMAEKCAMKYSDTVIVLNKRDKLRQEELYGRKPEYQMPISFLDKVDNSELDTEELAGKPMKGLFVGAYSRSNYEGMKWFVENVAEHVHAEFVVAGKGMEQVRTDLERDNVTVLGMVDDLKATYLDADFVIAPILFGGGMKVKIAEAFMYGKTVFGTTEAFEGYEVDYKKTGGLCDKAEEYIQAINAYVSKQQFKVNRYNRQYFLENHETSAMEKILEEIFL